jgi:hypothetical protein
MPKVFLHFSYTFQLSGRENLQNQKLKVGCGGVDLNHRPLGYECHHQQNLKTMRGAKSNALSLRRASRNHACPVLPFFLSCL